MSTLTITAAILLAVFLALWAYFRRSPPDTSPAGIGYLRLGLRFAIVSSAALVVGYTLSMTTTPVGPKPNPFFAFWALGGNLCNLIALIYCLRELSAEGMVSAIFVVAGQVLWLLFAMKAILVDF
jgi:hypothetical protein